MHDVGYYFIMHEAGGGRIADQCMHKKRGNGSKKGYNFKRKYRHCVDGEVFITITLHGGFEWSLFIVDRVYSWRFKCRGRFVDIINNNSF